MTWITTIAYNAATGRLKKLYDRVKGPDNNVDNIMMAHSLRPHTMEGHMALYKHVLHHTANETPKWMLEVVGVYVSMLNECPYCIEHHFAGLSRLLNDEARASEIQSALRENQPSNAFDAKGTSILAYARKLTQNAADVSEKDITQLRETGLNDGEILEINQVTAYFNYANRTVLGLGIKTDGDIIGLSPNQSDKPDNWNHN